jgi:hypothetical protein
MEGRVSVRQEVKTNEGTRAGVCGYGTRRNICLSLEKYTTVFQTEVYTTKTRVVENLDRYYKNRNICIPSDSQAVSKATSQLPDELKPALGLLSVHR